MEQNIIEIKDLCFSYEEEQQTLQNISVSIGKGERIAVLGENGAGKSTFFLNLNGVRTPESGSIRLYGTEIHKKNRNLLQKNVGIVFQDADNQIIASTVKAEVAFGPMNMGLPPEEVEKRTDCALEEMELKEYAGRPPHYLSGGEKKRVSIADIVAMDTDIIIFDEPTASLDPVNADMLETVLTRLTEEGKTILLSTHDVDFAYRFADRILVFSNGRMIADDTPDKVFMNRELLAKAHLKQPVLMQITDLLYAKGKLSLAGEEGTPQYPKTLQELADYLD